MQKPYWFDENTWICPQHLPGTRLPAGLEECWYNHCKSVRPERQKKKDRTMAVPSEIKVVRTKFKDPVVDTDKNAVCAWHECDSPATGKSKYCSRNCSNKNARARYKARKVA